MCACFFNSLLWLNTRGVHEQAAGCTLYEPVCLDGAQNKTLISNTEMLRCFLEGKSRQWDRHLHMLAGALRTAPHRTTGFSPNMMIREVVQPKDIVFGIAKANNSEPEPTPEHMRALRRALGEVHSTARERNLPTAAEKNVRSKAYTHQV